MTRLERMWQWVIVSILIHILLFAALIANPQFFERFLSKDEELKNSEHNSVRTRVLSEQQFRSEYKFQKTIVQSERAEDQKKSKSKAKYLGEQTQRVEKETVSKSFGSIQGGIQGKEGEKSEKKIKHENPSVLEQLGFSAGIGSKVKPLPHNEKADGENGHQGGGIARLKKGSMDLVDSDVAIGTQTLLNTDEYVYASFFNRLKSEVGPRWEPLVQIVLNTKKGIDAGFYRTETVFILDPSGNIIDVKIERASAERSFDNAAKESLMQLIRVENPPSGLRDKDGFYRVHLGFVVSLATGGNLKMDYVPDPRLVPK